MGVTFASMSGFAQSFLDVDQKFDVLPGTPRESHQAGPSTHIPLGSAQKADLGDDSSYFALEEDGQGMTVAAVATAGDGATLESCIINLCNTILGAGMLGLPHALGNCGWVLGLFLMCVMCGASGFGLWLLSLCSIKARTECPESKPQSFYTLSERTIPGRWGGMIVDAAVAIKCFGVGTSYFIVIGDLVPEALEGISEHIGSPWNLRQSWIGLYALVLCGPLVLLKDLNALRFTSGAALGFVVFIVVVFLIFVAGAFDTCPNGADGGSECGTSGYSCTHDCAHTSMAPESALDALEVFTIFIFGFTCHQNIFSVCNELQGCTTERVGTVIKSSLGSCLGVYVLVAACGYALYGSEVESDVLKSFPQSNWLLILGRIAISILVAFSYPLQIHPCRNSLRQLLFGSNGLQGHDGRWVAGEGGYFDSIDRSEEAEERRFYIMTACLFAASFGVSMCVTSLGLMLAVVGATGSTTISYILPGYFYYAMFGADDDFMVTGAKGMFVAGCIIIPGALTMIVATGKGE